MRLSRAAVLVGGGLAVGMLGGCAHAPAAPTVSVTNTQAPVVAAKPAPAPVAKPVDSGDADLEALLRGDVVHFDFEQADLSTDSKQRLQAIAQLMQAHAQIKIRVAGNCDERGTEEYNLTLGQRRAEVARKYLVALGVAPERVGTITYGKERPVSEGHDEQAWQQNRRDDITPVGP